jgi:hypothetical protein
MTPVAHLRHWLVRQLPAEESAWLEACAARLRGGGLERDLYLSVSQVSRRVGKDLLRLTMDDLQAAATSRPGWDPCDWTVDQTARVHLLLASTTDGAELSRRLDRLCSAADIGELVAFYRGLPLYPDQPRHASRAAEGVRSNMRVVFEAIAHRNPYAAEQFAEPAWNQLVLKALFVGSRLDLIAGLDGRRNPTLARMLCDYAHERWAASRPVNPELWRCVGPFAAGAVLDDFRRLLERGTTAEQQAAALALLDATDPAAAQLLEYRLDVAHDARAGRVSWAQLAAMNN